MNEIFTLLFQRLVVDLSPISVYDHVPQSLNDNDYPYVKIGALQLTQNDTDTETGFEVTVDIVSYSRYRGTKEINQLTDFIYQSLHNWNILNSTTYAIGTIQETSRTTLVTPDGLTRNGLQSFRLYFEPL